MAQALVYEHASWDRTIAELFSQNPDGTPKHKLTEDEHKAIIGLADKFCDWGEEIYEWIEHGNLVLRTIAIAHSYPNTKK